MAQIQSPQNDPIEVRVVEPGDDCNIYNYDVKVEGLRLVGVHRTKQPAPIDFAIVPDTSTNGEPDLKVLLVRRQAMFPGCAVKARPIGLLEIQDGPQLEYRIIAVPDVDDGMGSVATIADLPEASRQAITGFVKSELNGHHGRTLRWAEATNAYQVIHQARQAARLARAKASKGGPATPAWQPLGYRAAGARRPSDTQPHTEAEYAYHQLPRRFQHYVADYLAPGERILFAANRPAMKSALKRTWLSAPTLQEAILFITDQQVALVTEKARPGRANIRYGYLVHTGIPERIEAVAVNQTGDHAMFEITWRAVGGNQRVCWEFAAEAAEELQEAAVLLRGWQPRPGDTRLRRAYGPEPVEVELRDPAANEPGEVTALACRLEERLAAELAEAEFILARALLPAWADSHKIARLLAVTNCRLLLLPDPAGSEQLTASYGLERVASVEFTSSILDSWLSLNLLDAKGELSRVQINFPYTAADFRTCFTVLRQQLTALPER